MVVVTARIYSGFLDKWFPYVHTFQSVDDFHLHCKALYTDYEVVHVQDLEHCLHDYYAAGQEQAIQRQIM